MGRLLRALLGLAVIGFAALAGYAYLGDYGPDTREITQPVTLDAD